jgi:putative two-component system response regulator
MTKHPQIGYEILSGSDSSLIRFGAEIALAHHEKWDGSGYPNKLTGEAIPLSGRIVAVADVFDALTSERPYKAAWPLDKARKLLEDNSGSHFDPVCVAAFLAEWDAVLQIRAEIADDPMPQPDPV